MKGLKENQMIEKLLLQDSIDKVKLDINFQNEEYFSSTSITSAHSRASVVQEIL